MKSVFYKVRHKDSDVCKNSSSGGAFTALSDRWFDIHNNAVVYGAVMQENLKVRHIRADTKQGRDMMRGSKYIMSNMSGIYKQIESDMENGRYVLFSGTPCQVFAVKNFCKNKGLEYEKYLLTIEVICHGTAKTKFFEDYILHMEKKYKSKAVSCSFRAKSKPEKKQDIEIKFKNGRTYNAPTTQMDIFYMMYLQSYVMNEQCYRCSFANPKRNADISIADFWPKNKNIVKEDWSLVIVNTEKGLDIFNNCESDILCDKTSIDQVALPNFFDSTKRPKQYKEFCRIYSDDGLSGVIKYMGCNSLKFKLRYFIVLLADKINIITLLREIRHR